MEAGDEAAEPTGMIDNFALALSHGLMMLAAWRLLKRPDLDREDQKGLRPFARRADGGGEPGAGA